MKKLISVFLVLMLVMSLGLSAFADDTFTDMPTVTVKKSYKLVGAGSSPAETFTMVEDAAKRRVVDGDTTYTVPALGEITGAAYTATDGATAEGNVKDIIINLPTYDKVGVYEYQVKEVIPTAPNAGVTYYSDPIVIRVTVIEQSGKIRVGAVHVENPVSPSYEEGSTKTDTFTNTYSAGSLSVSKTVTGNLGDKNKYFKVTVTLTGETGKTYPASFAVSGGSYTSNPTTAVLGANVFYLKDGETISIANLPYGVTYTVVEDNYTGEGYDAAEYTFSDSNKKIDSAEDTVGITNNKDIEVDTGLFLDSLPYVLTLGIVAAALVIYVSRKRLSREN